MADESTYLERLQALADKVDSPVRQAYFQQFGEGKYADSEFLNLLRDALIDVYQNGGGSSGNINQDNIDRSKRFSVTSIETAALVSTINTAPQFTIEDTESFWFVFILNVSGQSRKTYKYKLLNKGKGIYGVGGNRSVEGIDLELVSNPPTTENDYQTPTTTTVNFGALTTQTVSQWLNGRAQSILIQAQDAGYTLFKGTVNGKQTTYLWIGAPGRYGIGYLSSAMSDFEIVNEVSAATVRAVGITYSFSVPENTIIDYFQYATSVLEIKLLGGIASVAYSINQGATYTVVALPLVAPLNIPENTRVDWRISYLPGSVRASFYLKL